MQPQRFQPETAAPPPVIALAVRLRSETAGEPGLLRALLADIDYPKKRLRVLVQCEPRPEAERELAQAPQQERAAFLALDAELDSAGATGLSAGGASQEAPGESPPAQLASLRQRALDWIFQAPPPAAYAAFVDADTLWPNGLLQALLSLASLQCAAVTGIAPTCNPERPLPFLWFPNPPLGARRVCYEPEDIPPIPFPVDSAGLNGTLVPVPILKQFRDRGGWRGYAFSPFYESDLEPDDFLFLTDTLRRPVWVHPDVTGCRLGPSGMGYRFDRILETGKGRIVDQPVERVGIF